MFSLNVPLPPAVTDLAGDLHPKLEGFDRVRERHTLVCKRFGVDDVSDRVADHVADGVGGPSADPPRPPKPDALAALREALRPLLAGTDPFEVAVTGLDAFESPASGSGPVVYLAVESDVLVRLHRRLCAAYGAIEGIEGDGYVPHVTLARGGDPDASGEAIDRLVEREFEPIRWRVHALDLYDPEFREVVETVEL
ncbi:2'-5' RNA ligase family protein [Halorubrum sp. CBA1125]|uniref:2'-5' RNA ligase family protein n=1 Tax=Halorubrum sp. CBA1125 TaxID=2668072 RepID=UPI00135E9EA1|nr:2'-5' RNA ligase family protein [Halorubrum sp. CBA1125]MUW15132.1 2'-5' RNA ligase family protein [Halorubrum sp. CBA1125]